MDGFLTCYENTPFWYADYVCLLILVVGFNMFYTSVIGLVSYQRLLRAALTGGFWFVTGSFDGLSDRVMRRRA